MSKQPLFKYLTDQVICYHDQTPVELPEFEYKDNFVRGIWISNVANIDTPKLTSVEQYQEYLRQMIANIASYNINLMVFQVRPSSDAFYRSKLNPWSRFITGTEGVDPGFDVLEFVINEAKKFNIEVHAWMNPYRVSTSNFDPATTTVEKYLETLDPLNFARRNPDCLIQDGQDKIILKPASDKVIKFVTETITEVVNNYDITGVHIDDYFYPYAKIPREREEADYQKTLLTNPDLSFDDWRRRNVDLMIESIHNALSDRKITNKKVAFGISPFGIYRTHISINPEGWELGSYHAKGVCECYRDLYSDVYKWMKKGWIDYIVPQIYFPFERTDVNYHDLLKWWDQASESTKTTLYIGQGLYQMGSNEFWQNPDEIDNQLRVNQNYHNVSGTIFFTYRDLVKGQNDIKDQALDKLKKRWTQQ